MQHNLCAVRGETKWWCQLHEYSSVWMFSHLGLEVCPLDGSCTFSEEGRAWVRWGWTCRPCPLSTSQGPSPSSLGCSLGVPWGRYAGNCYEKVEDNSYLLGGFPNLVAGCLMWWVPKALIYLRLCSCTIPIDSSLDNFKNELYSLPTSSWNVMCLDNNYTYHNLY